LRNLCCHMPILALDRNVFNNLSTKDQFSTEKEGATKLSFCNTPFCGAHNSHRFKIVWYRVLS
jgi:hypothetical protein